MKTQKGSRGITLTLYLTSALDGVGGQRLVPAALTPRKRSGTDCTEGWVDTRASLDGIRKISSLIPGTSSLQQVALPTELS
jgi:hypothetical protein